MDLPADWTDADGYSCLSYTQENWCTVNGEYGSNWNETDYGAFSDYAVDGVSALDACCGCGGGSVAALREIDVLWNEFILMGFVAWIVTIVLIVCVCGFAVFGCYKCCCEKKADARVAQANGYERL